MIAGSDFVNVFGLVPPGTGEPEKIIRVARAAVKAGFAIVVCRPGTKVPMCTLTAGQAKKANREAQVEAQAAGNQRWSKVKHACGLAHALTDDATAGRVVTRLLKAYGTVNLGVEVGRSRVVVVDVDTPAESAAFLASWSGASGTDQTMRTPSVVSPGVLAPDGTPVHHGGGHWWFSLPDGIDLPAGTGVLKAPGGWVAMWAGHQVLVPPSVRKEGPYRLTGQCEPAPAWLTDMIIQEVGARQLRTARNLDRAVDSGNDLERWSATTTWDGLLEPDGWIATGLVDTCSCPIWTAPGYHASPKSATAHDIGCTRYDTETGWGPLHVWTDNPPDYLVGHKTVTKVQFIAHRYHEGSDREAIRQLQVAGELPSPAPGPDVSYDWTEGQVPTDTATDVAETDPFDCAGSVPAPEVSDGEPPARPAEPEPPRGRHVRVTRASDIRMRATRWLWQDEDAHWVPQGGLVLLGGREGVGKSTIAYGLAALVTRGDLSGAHYGAAKSIVIAATEDAWEQTVVPRLVACGADLARVFRVDVVSPEGFAGALSLPQDIASLKMIIEDQDVAMVLLDPLMTVISGRLDTHKDAEVRQALEPLSRLAHDTLTAVVGLIHVNKSTGADLLTRLMASRAFSAVARAVLFAARDDDGPAETGTAQADVPPREVFMLGQPKNNLAARVAHTLRYHIEGAMVGHDPDLDQPIFGSRIVWEGRRDERIDDVLSKQEARRAVPETPRDRAIAWLEKYLSGGKEVERGAVLAAAERDGHAEATIKRAFRMINGKARQIGRKAHWSLGEAPIQICDPGDPGDPGDTPDPGDPGSPSDLDHLDHGSPGSHGRGLIQDGS